MSMSIKQLVGMINSLEIIGKEHVFIDNDASVSKRTDGWFPRWQNRFCAFLGCGRDENRAIYDTFFKLIEQTKGFGTEYATLAKQFLDNVHSKRYAKGKPLSGRKAIKVINYILEKRSEDLHAIEQEKRSEDPHAIEQKNRENIDSCTQRAARMFGREVIPYARSLIEDVKNSREIVPKETINNSLDLKLFGTERDILTGVQTMIQELIENRSDEEAIDGLKDKILDFRRIHCFESDMNERTFWANSIILKKLLEQLDVVRNRLGWRVNPADAEKIIPEIRSSYGEDAIPFAREYMSLPAVDENMLRNVMADLHKRLEKEARESMPSEWEKMSAEEKRENIPFFIDNVTAMYTNAVRPIDKWMCRIFLTHLENEMEALQRPEMNVV